ncbi:ABC transporter ATP-binding protein [Echinicola jeungdonensis]|uniref:ABC transporter ATP-binding protein n=1 Tax=Echinicola jeungdonensis TaxID=709343 RepID=A0ABV5J755_9BACT|nr:ABC transporter ATP-binding protein [Echinicola jeungdonensis]MDN3669185.1 ABC transporter ATP-binding protein [Echinicola jeungdonensis]
MSIIFDQIDFSYSKNEDPLIQGFSLEAEPGDRLAIKGESGTGKTTIFRLLLGFEIPDQGTILFQREKLNPSNIKGLRQQTTWLPQDLDLGQGLLKEVFYHPFQFKSNLANSPSEETVLETINELGLPQKLWVEKFENLSTGQRQRVGIALCYLLQKPILLLDEPTSALDDASKEKVTELLYKKKSRTIISTSHDPWWLERCEKVVELSN